MTTLRVMLAQTQVRVGDLASNAATLTDAAARAEALTADVLLSPEMSVTGYPVEDLLAEPAFVAAALEHVRAVATTTGATVSILGAPLHAADLPAAGGARDLPWSLDAETRTLRNAAVLAHRGAVAGAHAKSLLPTYSVFDDGRHFGAGRRDQALYQVTTPTGPVTFAVLVCEDVWDPAMVVEAADSGAQVVLVSNASPYYCGKPAVRLAALQSAAAAAAVPIAYCNFVGGQDDLVFDGDSSVIDADGTILARATAFEVGELVVDIPVAPARPATRTVVNLGMTHERRVPVAPAPVAARLETNREVYTALVTGLRDYCQRVGIPRIVLGLSGGIDSALAAKIAVDALGPAAVWGIGMPGPYSSAGSVDDARALADNLGIRFDVVQIREPYEERHAALAGLIDGALADGFAPGSAAPVAWENLQARLRGTTLMTIANAVNALVSTTGNRSESAVGYFTLFGDSVGTAPNCLGDLLKTTVTLSDGSILPGVYGLSRWLNDDAAARGQVPPIPEATITKPASAELAEGQQDTDSLPPYEVLDKLLLAFLEDHATAQNLVDLLLADGWEQQVAVTTANRVMNLVDRSEFKRRQVPIRIKVSKLAFGRDRRMPLANHWSHATAHALETAGS